MTVEQLYQIADDPKRYLSRNYRSEMRMKAKRDRITHLREICYSMSQELKAVVVYTGPTSKLENCIAEILDLEKEIEAEILDLKQTQRETADAICSLLEDSTLVTLMEMRYLADKRWDEIAIDMNYAHRWVQRLHTRALQQMRIEAVVRLFEQAA